MVYDLLLDWTETLLQREITSNYIGHDRELMAEPKVAEEGSAKASETQSFDALG